MVFLFRDKSIANIFFLAVLCTGIHLHFFMATPQVISHSNDGLFSLVLQRYTANLSPTLLFLFYQLIVLLQAIRLNMVLGEMRMYPQVSYTTAMAYILLSGILPEWCGISSALCANFLLIWIFIKLNRLYNHPSPKTLLFNTGLIVGLSVLCYHPTAILIGVVLFALVVVRPFRLAEWIVLLMGILLPYYFLFAILFLQDKTADFVSFVPDLHLHLPVADWNVPLVARLFVLVCMLIAGLVFWQITHKRMVIQIRKNWGVMMVMLFILLPVPFIFKEAGLESAFMSIVPLTAFASNAFSTPRRLVLPNILFWLAIGLLVYNNWVMIMG